MSAQVLIASRLSLFLSLIVLGLKFLAYYLTRSTSVYSDALETIVNVLAAGFAFQIMRVVTQPADKEHPYGHGKLEYFSSAFEGGLIAFAALAIVYKAVSDFYRGPQILQVDVGFYLMIGAALVNLTLGLYLKKVAQQSMSAALQASSKHVLSDVWTTAGVVVSLVIVMITDWKWLDPIVALAVAFHLGIEGIKIVRNSASGLMDEMDQESLEKLSASIQKNRRPGFIDIHQLRMIRAGSFHHIDAHLVIPEFWDTKKAHEEASLFEKKVIAGYPYDGEIAFHLDPCERRYCRYCELSNCEIRKETFVAQKEFSPENLTSSVEAQ